MGVLGLTDRVLVLDAETSSPVDIKKAGQYRYWSHPETRTLMLAAAWLDGEPEDAAFVDYETGGKLPPGLERAIHAPASEVMLAAANAAFDQAALAERGYPTPDEKWLDVLTLARILGFAGGLDAILEQAGLQKKDPEGTRLITLFSINREPWSDHPEKWQKFRQYCLRDARVERNLLKFCLHALPRESYSAARDVLQQDLIYRKINGRGLPVDLPAVRGALAIRNKKRGDLCQELERLTQLENPNSRDQLLDWCQSAWAEGADRLPNLQQATVRDALLLETVPPKVRSALEIRQQIGLSSTKKLDAFVAATDPVTDRLRGGWQFYGASRTGRVAGRIVNPANLPRPAILNPEAVAALLPLAEPELIETTFPEKDVLTTLGSTIRALLKAPSGKRWCVADLTSIESVGAAWLAGCQSILDIFLAGRDTYRTFAAKAEGIPYESVTKEQRQFYKPPVLAGAYQISGAGLAKYAQNMGVEMSEDDGYRLIDAFRTEYHEIVHYWSQLEDAARQAIKNPGFPFDAAPVRATIGIEMGYNGREYKTYSYKPRPRIRYIKKGDFLFCILPSDRFLAYYRPKLFEVQITPIRGRPFTIPEAIHYYGTDQKSPGQQWRLINAAGGALFENVVQALCRDILWHGLALAEQDPDMEVVGDVYDEILTLVDKHDTTALDRLKGYMTTIPPWADSDLFLAADGYVSKRYRK